MSRDGDEVLVASLTAVGTGHIDFKAAFAEASLAGLKYFVVEQDNAAAWGSSLAAARVSFQNLKEILRQN